MNKTFLFAFLAALVFAGCAAYTQTNTKISAPGASVANEPDAYYSFLSAPTSEATLARDLSVYRSLAALRDTPRWHQAIRDGSISAIPELFSEAFGMQISPETTPAIHALVLATIKAMKKASHAVKKAPDASFRTRPFVALKTQTCAPEYEAEQAKSNSYLSGHSARGWGVALVLIELNPTRTAQIAKRGLEYGQSRAVCGYHWQSDVEDARLLASAALARLHAKSEFVAKLQAAKDEFTRLKSKK